MIKLFSSMMMFLHQTGNLKSSERMRELEKRFEQQLVNRARTIRSARPPVEKPHKIPPSKVLHWHKDESKKKPAPKEGTSQLTSNTYSKSCDEGTPQ